MATLNKVWKPLADIVRTVQKAARKQGFTVTITSGYRSKADQKALQELKNQYPVATPGKSQHQYGFAVDLVAKPWDRQSVLVSWMKSAGVYWLGASDPVHFQVFTPSEWAVKIGRVESGFTQPAAGASLLPAAVAAGQSLYKPISSTSTLTLADTMPLPQPSAPSLISSAGLVVSSRSPLRNVTYPSLISARRR